MSFLTDEKSSLLGDDVPVDSVQSVKTNPPFCGRHSHAFCMWARHRTLIFLNCAAACAIFLVLYFQITSPWPNEVEAPISYAGENIQWTRCGDIGDRPLECSNITVPMDQFDTTQSNIRVSCIILLKSEVTLYWRVARAGKGFGFPKFQAPRQTSI